MTHPSQIIHFLERCYQADNRERLLLDIFAKKVEFRHFPESPADLITGLISSLPLAKNRRELLEVAKTVHLQRTEREFLFTAFMLIGRFRRDEDPETGQPVAGQVFCGPLFAMPASLEDDDLQPVLTVNFERQQVNFPLLLRLGQQHDLPTERIEALVAELPRGPWDLSAVAAIAETLSDAFPDLHLSDLALYPEPEKEKTLRELRRRKEARGADLRAVFSTCLVMQRKSVNTRGVLSELHRLAESTELSTPLRRLLGAEDDAPAQRHSFAWKVPAVLSEAQQRVLENAANEPLSLVIGPPGTGKSFTIAALAIDALERGESVLVASKMDHAVDVVADKIEELLGVKAFVVRGGRQQYRKEISDLFERLLRGILPYAPLRPSERKQLDDTCHQLARSLKERAARLVARGRAEKRWGELDVEAADEYGLKRLKAFVLREIRGATLATKTPYWDEMAAYRRDLNEFIDHLAAQLRDRIVQRLRTFQLEHRPALQQLVRSLRARHASQREKRFDQLDPELLFEALPLWMVRLADVDTVVPMNREMFDLAIIDEATQCDIASCLPIFQRAKRVAIVGDPHQLRHLSFLSGQRQEHLASRLGLPADLLERFDYRNRSILDLMEDRIGRQEQVVMLDEHFRSAPAIISFSNREFYGGRLKIMQDRPEEDASFLSERRIGGERRDDGVNEAEAEALIAELERRIEQARSLPNGLRPSFGVLSPFRAQTDFLTERLGQRLNPMDVAEHDMLIGTPFGFQGEERDIMLLSLTVDGRTHPSAIRFLARPDILNVAITRARNEQVVFTSLDAESANSIAGFPLLARFLTHLRLGHLPRPQPAQPFDPFLNEVEDSLERRNLRLFPAYPIAGLTVDLVIESDARSLGIDLVGYPGAFSHAFDIERYRLFARAGLRIMPLPYSAWRRDRQRCVDAILQALAADA